MDKDDGLKLYCFCCHCELPLLHPHIMIERLDEKGNLICEECYQKEVKKKKKELIKKANNRPLLKKN